jgi:hypothetical protein
MGNLVFQATLGGQVNLVGPNTSSTYNINVPSVNGNLVTTGDTGTVTNTMLAGSIANAKLTNSSVTVGSTSIALGASATTVAGLTLTSPVISTISNTGTLTLPTSTDTLVGRATTDTLTNKTLTTPVISSLSSASATALTLQSAGTTAVTIDTSQNVIVNQASTIGTGGKFQVISNTDTLYSQTTSSVAFAALILNVQNTAARLAAFQYGNTTAVGTITTNGTNTSYNTSSDYRLKTNIQPLTGALSVINRLKPSKFTWISNSQEDTGFIAHELQEVLPNAVNGTKDQIDEDGNPVYQGIDTSFLVATLTAAIQELKAMNDSLTARVVALEAK